MNDEFNPLRLSQWQPLVVASCSVDTRVSRVGPDWLDCWCAPGSWPGLTFPFPSTLCLRLPCVRGLVKVRSQRCLHTRTSRVREKKEKGNKMGMHHCLGWVKCPWGADAIPERNTVTFRLDGNLMQMWWGHFFVVVLFFLEILNTFEDYRKIKANAAQTSDLWLPPAVETLQLWHLGRFSWALFSSAT